MVNLEDSYSDANPLDAALRVIRHHAMKNYGDTIAPYPMLIVRPDGVSSYAAARKAMMEWDDQFGYELVPAGVKLAYDRADPALKKRVDDAVRQEVIKQHGRQKLAARLRAGGGPGRSRQRFPTLSAASMDRRGRASGFEDHRDGKFSRNSFAQGGYGESPYSGTGAEAASELDKYLRDLADDEGTPGAGSDPRDQSSAGDRPPGGTAVDQLGGFASDLTGARTESKPGGLPAQEHLDAPGSLTESESGQSRSLSDRPEPSSSAQSNPFLC